MRLFIDTETTGLPRRRGAAISELNNWPRLVQVAWVLLDDAGREIIAREYVIRPENFSIPAESTAVHGISTEFAKANGHGLSDVMEEFSEVVDQSDIVIAHNMDFDAPVLGAEFLRCGMSNKLESVDSFCTMVASTDFCAIRTSRGYKWPTLEELHRKLFGKSQGKAHNALVDVRVCIKCYDELVERDIISPVFAEEMTEGSSSGGAAPSTDDIQEIIDDVLSMGDEHHWFDPGFVHSLDEQYADRGFLTDAQIDALENIRDMLWERS